jgi:hypothetical protein
MDAKALAQVAQILHLTSALGGAHGREGPICMQVTDSTSFLRLSRFKDTSRPGAAPSSARHPDSETRRNLLMR